MATNRKRTTRKPKSAIPDQISDQYRKILTLKDFMGTLEDHEVPVAAKAGVLVWDLWKKAGKGAAGVTFHKKGLGTAPVFDGYGNPKNRYYDKYVINNYAELAAYKAKK